MTDKEIVAKHGGGLIFYVNNSGVYAADIIIMRMKDKEWIDYSNYIVNKQSLDFPRTSCCVLR